MKSNLDMELHTNYHLPFGI